MKLRFEKSSYGIYIFNFSNGESISLNDMSFREKGPLLLDVSITNRCFRGCSFCYRKAQPSGQDISLNDYIIVLDQATKCGVTQIAIGGGEPTLHPKFVEILKTTREFGIIPNYSTNGDCLTKDIIDATKNYCGAIAISIYNEIEKYESLVKLLKSSNILVNFHFILTDENLSYLISLLKSPPTWFQDLNAIIFLNFKPANGENEKLLKYANKNDLELFFKLATSFRFCSIGFDTCSYGFIKRYTTIDTSLFDYCEASRKSAYINEKLEVSPCSFYKDSGSNLHNISLQEIWNKNPLFTGHRMQLEKCKKCPLYDID